MIGVVAPGARVVIRDAEWLVRKVDTTSTGGHSIHAVGLSELVKDREAIFLSELGRDIKILDPAATQLVPDRSPQFRDALLYIESLMRQTPPTDPPSQGKIYLGHKAAMDLVSYQLDPALQARQQPRQRILIADAVGLGKTLEAGVLLAELIRRGRGKRILVVALKSMLTQFEKELWARFAIGLTRLDSVGIQRVRHQIPSNHNPFYYFDRTIISIDTLKQDSAYRPYIENCDWDIIVIDEAHNVAERGSSSLRSKLAALLASRSDTLIMLSATPHDGRKASFASLMNMLNPTAIANPEDYGPEDTKGLFIRRFKKDIQHQVASAFMDRTILKAHCTASGLHIDGISPSDFSTIKEMPYGTVTRTVTDDTIADYRFAYGTFCKDGVEYHCPCPDHPDPIEGPVERNITYVAPFTKCDREEDYRTAWKHFEERLSAEELQSNDLSKEPNATAERRG